MSGYRRRPDRIADPWPLLGKLRACRDELVRAQAAVKPAGVVSHALSMVVAAIDGLAAVLTGEPYYFMVMGSTASEGARSADADKRARERGEP